MEVYKREYEVYTKDEFHPEGGDLVEIFDTKEEAIEFVLLNGCESLQIIEQSYTKDEWFQMEANALPGNNGYYM